MTSAELRRLAERKLAEASALAADADRLRAQAAALRGLLEPIVPMSRRVWVGPAAEDFEANARLHLQQIDLQALRLMRIAGEFNGEADRLRRQAAALQRQANLQRQAETAEAAVASPVLPSGVI